MFRLSKRAILLRAIYVTGIFPRERGEDDDDDDDKSHARYFTTPIAAAPIERETNPAAVHHSFSDSTREREYHDRNTRRRDE
jgi:hypothetical protein